MKYGIIVYKGNHGNTVKRQGKALFNLGDCMQMIAMRRIYTEEMGIPEDDIVEIDFHELHDYDGEYIVVPVNLFFFGCGDKRKIWFPASPKIIPVFIGVHFDTAYFSEEQVQYLRQWAPIGCRDYFTLQNMQKYNIPAYLFGCVTATLPARKTPPENGKAFLVDVPDSLLKYIPKDIKERSETVTQEWEDEFSPDIFERMYSETQKLLRRYKEEAALVVTSRLHCASPCMAMGIPTILTVKEKSSRLAWLERQLRMYTPDHYSEIDWEPAAAEYSEQKKKMTELVVSRLQNAFEQWKAVYDVSEYWEKDLDPQSYQNPLDQFYKSLDVAFSQQDQSYIIWGLTCHAEEIYRYIRETYPRAKLLAVVDEYENAPFYGLQPIKSAQVKEYPSALLLITPTSAKSYVEEKAAQNPEWGARLYMTGEIKR